MTNTVKKALRKNPYVLFEYGVPEKKELETELNKYDFKFPKELIKFWQNFGGGDLFETETILYPVDTDNIEYDSMPVINRFLCKQEFDNNYYIFHTNNATVTAFHKQTHEIAVFDNEPRNYKIEQRFKNIDEWFFNLWHMFQ